MQIDIIINIVVATLSAFLKIIQIFVFSDEKTGLLLKTPTSNFIGNTSFVLFIIVLLVNLKTTVDITHITEKMPVKMKPKTGYFLFATAFFFFIQGLFDVFNHVLAFHEAMQGIYSAGTDVAVNKLSYIFLIFIDIICMVSGICFYLLALKRIKGITKINFMLYVIPTIWAICSMISAILAVSSNVSIQSFEEKMIVMAFMVAFVYYVVACESGLDEKPKSYISTFFKISFTTIVACLVLPYIVSGVFLKGKQNLNTPHLAILGLAIYGFSIYMQYIMCSMKYFSKKRKVDYQNKIENI